MRHYSLKLSLLIYCGVLSTSAAYGELTPEQRLIEQIQLGEGTNRDDIIQPALSRLEIINPNNPELIAARIRQSLRQRNIEKASIDLTLLSQLAPDSQTYQQSKVLVMLASSEGMDKLQQARELVKANKLVEARAAYDNMFASKPPSLELAAEYWRLVSRLPGQQSEALRQLQKLEQQTPGNANLRNSLVKVLFAEGENDQGFALLARMASTAATRDEAAVIWLNQIKAMPVSTSSIDYLKSYLSYHPEGQQYNSGQQLLTLQQQELTDPAFMARQDGLVAADKNAANAIRLLEKALQANPNDAEVLGALGAAYGQNGYRVKAIALLERAQKLDSTNSQWQSSLKINRYWLLIQQGDDALKAGNLSRAESDYQQAHFIDNDDDQAKLGLADVAVARQDDKTAKRYYQQILKQEPQNTQAFTKLVSLYQRQSPAKALAYLDLHAKQNYLASNTEVKNLRSNVLQQQAELFENQKDWQKAVTTLQQARQLTPDDTWLTYHLARDLQQTGQSAQADQIFSALAARHPHDSELIYAYALYLSGSDRDTQALQQLNTLPKQQWTDNIKTLAQRLQTTITLAQANKMREQGDEKAAISYLEQQPADERIAFTLAEWAVARQDYPTAHHIYQQLLEQNSRNQEAILGDAESYLAQGEKEAAKQRLAFFDQHPTNSLNLERRIANAWQALGDIAHADQYYQAMYQAIQHQTPSTDNALIWRDIANAQQQNGQPQQALNSYRQAMVASGITTTLPENNEEFTRLTRNNPDDDWLKRSVRANAGELYQQQNTTVTLDYDRWGSSGTGGISNLSAQTTMLEVDTPYYDGRGFFRTDFVQMNAGTFSYDGSGVYTETFGTCHTVGCSSDYSQKANGASFAVGWKNKIWNADIGTTPLGFDVVDWVGGVSYKTDWQNIGWTLTASRRPISSSLLSFAGTKDPRTGTTWGGVRATGPSLGLSYDQGQAHGVWADLSAHQLTGKNVETNQRARLMAGYYYRVINEEDREVKVGLSNMLWRYQKDLSNYSLGQGGYYSPQRYFSVGLPISYRQRTENWSWDVSGAVSWSTSSTKDQRRYPLRNLIESDLPDIDAIETGGSSSGVGYTAKVLIERRLTSHWSIGAGFDLQKAKDYAPSHSLLYLRYSFDDWRGRMDMPPQPLTPYADFK